MPCFVAVLLFFSCNPHKSLIEEGKTYETFRGFEPVDPTEYNQVVEIVENGIIINKKIKLLKTDEMLQFLNNETALVSIAQLTADGKISYVPVTVSAKYGNYKVTVDYMKFATLGQQDSNERFIGFKRVGVGLRLISLITTSEAGINIGDLSSLGLAAKAGKVKGTLMIEVVGIKSKDVTTLLPIPSEINQTTIQNAMQALATIKSKIYDGETKLFPQVMAVMVLPQDTTKAKSQDNMQKSRDLEDKIRLQTANNNISVAATAKDLEQEAFDQLFQKQVAEAIAKFNECESAYPTYHSVKEIRDLLTREKGELLNSGSSKWQDVYATILTKYSWKLSDETMERLKAESGRK